MPPASRAAALRAHRQRPLRSAGYHRRGPLGAPQRNRRIRRVGRPPIRSELPGSPEAVLRPKPDPDLHDIHRFARRGGAPPDGWHRGAVAPRPRRGGRVSSKLLWYAARSNGLVAWGLLAAAVLWGLALSTKVLGRRPRPSWILDLHRFLGVSALAFTAIHVVTVVLDTYVHFGLVEVLVPFTGAWHPAAVAWGIAS